MATISARSISYTTAEERILRQLGGAVVVQWASFSDQVRSIILLQAPLMDDRDALGGMNGELRSFIKARQPGGLKATVEHA